MSTISRAIETTGTVDPQGRITLDHPVAGLEKGRVRVIILLPGGEEQEPSESEWLRAAGRNPVFAFLADEEDLYSLEDGRPFHDAG
jgi:hypothetical protein